MNKELVEIINDNIYIGDLSDEIKHNCWSISLTLTFQALEEFFEKLLKRRKEQIKILAPNREIYFYVFNDYQSGHIKFNLISATDDGLPFASPYVIVDSLAVILTNYIAMSAFEGECEPGMTNLVYCQKM